MFKKILIANRGEIACRVMRTCNELGISTVGVYSDADENALHVREAGEAVHIGASLASESYLNIGKIVDAATRSGAQAVHPGYGFLSENAEFVEAVEAAGLVFIGPSASAIRAMGLKDAAKALMEEAGVPVVPGYHGDNQDAAFLASEAAKIGYPVMIKARAGGGGKGMRLVESAGEFSTGLEGAVREGQASFGDGHVLIEKYITSPRHIEIQVFGDDHGNVVHMFERDCSLQRRHQKVIEEAPAPGMTKEVRAAMGAAAVKAAKAVNYSGAGTVEFIVDGSEGLRADRFWFMEMNTRLQVEHPVTEMITGLDLVELQLKVAGGDELPFAQDDLSINGWAFEARIYAEDPANGFLPSVGVLEAFLPPVKECRFETGVEGGDEISSHYDPMIAKLVVHGTDRSAALEKLLECLENTLIAGLSTNIAFLCQLCRDTDFSTGNMTTGLIADKLENLTAITEPDGVTTGVAALCLSGMLETKSRTALFSGYTGWRQWGEGALLVDLDWQKEAINVGIEMPGDGNFIVDANGTMASFTVVKSEWIDPNSVDVVCDGEPRVVEFDIRGNQVTIFDKGTAHVFRLADPLENTSLDASNSNTVIAPMPGLMKAVKVQAGDEVRKGQVLMILEAMKMEHSLIAAREGVIEVVNAVEGEQVDDGAILVTLEIPLTPEGQE